MYKKKAFGIAVFLGALFAVAVYADFEELLPVGDGALTDWSVSSGANHYELVDDATTCDGTGSYVQTRTVGDIDTFGYDITNEVPDGATINSITIYPCASGAGTAPGYNTSTFAVYYTLDGVDSSEANYVVMATTSVPVELGRTTWENIGVVKDSNTTLEGNIKLVSSWLGAYSRVSRLRIEIDYTP